MKKIVFLISFVCMGLFGSEHNNNLWHELAGDKKLDWNEANVYCSALSVKDAQNWRLPTLRELINNEGSFLRSSGQFYDYYWSSTEYSKNRKYAWAVTDTSYQDYHKKTLKNYVSCVGIEKPKEIQVVKNTIIKLPETSFGESDMEEISQETINKIEKETTEEITQETIDKVENETTEKLPEVQKDIEVIKVSKIDEVSQSQVEKSESTDKSSIVSSQTVTPQIDEKVEMTETSSEDTNSVQKILFMILIIAICL